MPWNAEVLTMPVWAFHGDADDAVDPRKSIAMVERLKTCNPNVRFTLFPGVGHNAWEYAYCDDLFQWMLSQRKA